MQSPRMALFSRGWSLLELLLSHSLVWLTLSAVLVCATRWRAWDHRMEQNEAAWSQVQALEAWMRQGLLHSSMWRGSWLDASALPACGGGRQPCSACSEPNGLAPSGISWLTQADGSGSVALRLSAGVVQARLGEGKWQAYTDPTLIHVEHLACEVRNGLLIVHLRARAAASGTPARNRQLHLAWSRI